jgi:predicted nucleic acid-binding protein
MNADRLVVVDASVVIKWVIPEDDSDLAFSLRGRCRFAAPDLLFAEVANILWKTVRRGDISTEEYESALAALRFFKPQTVTSSDLFEEASRLAILLDHPAYDCFYLVCAARLGTVMVTADARLLNKLAGTTLTEWTPFAMSIDDAVAAL